MKKSILSIVASFFAIAGLASAGTVNFTNTTGASGQVQLQVDGVPIAAGTGFVAVGTTSLTLSDLADAVTGDPTNGGTLSTAAQAALASDPSLGFGGFEVFEAQITIGVNGLGGYFSGSSEVVGADYANNWVGDTIVLIAGNGNSIATSTHLAIFDGGTFLADNPLAVANIGTASTLAFGTVSGESTAIAGRDAIQLGAIADVIPEPGVSILALPSAGIIFLRRRR